MYEAGELLQGPQGSQARVETLNPETLNLSPTIPGSFHALPLLLLQPGTAAGIGLRGWRLRRPCPTTATLLPVLLWSVTYPAQCPANPWMNCGQHSCTMVI